MTEMADQIGFIYIDPLLYSYLLTVTQIQIQILPYSVTGFIN